VTFHGRILTSDLLSSMRLWSSKGNALNLFLNGFALVHIPNTWVTQSIPLTHLILDHHLGLLPKSVKILRCRKGDVLAMHILRLRLKIPIGDDLSVIHHNKLISRNCCWVLYLRRVDLISSTSRSKGTYKYYIIIYLFSYLF
jgi:hypothetical protein